MSVNSESIMTEETKKPDEPQVSAEKKKAEHPRNSWFLWTRDIVICLILVLLFRANVAEANYIPSESMEPTLMVNDRIIVDKLSLKWRPLERGDMVVFHPPEKTGHENERWIKRVIGLPGETVSVNHGQVYVDGHELDEPYIRDIPGYSVEPIDLMKDDPSTKVNEGEYFLLGDNRPNSRDSHVWGSCPADRIIGRAILRYWPLNKMSVLYNSNKDVKVEE